MLGRKVRAGFRVVVGGLVLWTAPLAADPVVERARSFLDDGRGVEAVRVLDEAAKTGSVAAQALLCLVLQGEEFRGDVLVDLQRAAFWCRKAAEAGDRASQVEIGDLYDTGQGVIRNLPLAKAWYERAARGGEVRGMLALCEMLGYGGELHDAEAGMAWCVRAAVGGSGVAQWLVGQKMESDGELGMAYGWYVVASESGNPLARERLERAWGFDEFTDEVRQAGEAVAEKVRAEIRKNTAR